MSCIEMDTDAPSPLGPESDEQMEFSTETDEPDIVEPFPYLELDCFLVAKIISHAFSRNRQSNDMSTHISESPITTNFALASPSLLALLLDSVALPESPLIVSEHSTFLRLHWVMQNRPDLHHDLAPARLRVLIQPRDLPLLEGLEQCVSSLTLHDPFSRGLEVERGNNRSSPLYELESLLHLPPVQSRGQASPTLGPFRRMANLHALDLSEALHLARSVLLRHMDGQHAAALRDLNLAGCVLTPEILAHAAASFPRLASLNLANCTDVSDMDLEHVGRLTDLRALTLAFCPTITDSGLRHLAGLTALERLSLRGCSQLRDEGLQALANLARLTHLDLSNNVHFSAEGLFCLRGLKQLRVLMLRCCVRVSDACAPSLQQLAALEELDVSACWNLSPALLLSLRGLGALRRLRVPGALEEHVREILPGVDVNA